MSMGCLAVAIQNDFPPSVTLIYTYFLVSRIFWDITVCRLSVKEPPLEEGQMAGWPTAQNTPGSEGTREGIDGCRLTLTAWADGP